MQVTIVLDMGSIGLRDLLLRRLGLERETTPEEARSAYRALALRTHPDQGGDVEEFRAIHAAYKTLQEHGWA